MNELWTSRIISHAEGLGKPPEATPQAYETGLHFAERLVVLVGQKKAVAIAVRNVSGRHRWSKLQEWLRSGAPLSRQIGMVG